jgi:hypothetical protein
MGEKSVNDRYGREGGKDQGRNSTPFSVETAKKGDSTSAGRQADIHAPDKGKMRLVKPTGIKKLPQEAFMLFCARMAFSPQNLNNPFNPFM